MPKLLPLLAAILATLAAPCSHAEEDLAGLAKKGMGLIEPYATLSDGSHDAPYTEKDPLTDKARADLREGIAILSRITAQRPDFWPGFLFIGMAHQASGDHATAYEDFKKAYELHPPIQSGASREFALEALCTHHDDEAVAAARKDVAEHPDDAVLAANLGYVLLGVGQVDAAQEAASRALLLAPSDQMTPGLMRDILGVRAGTVVARRC